MFFWFFIFTNHSTGDGGHYPINFFETLSWTGMIERKLREAEVPGCEVEFDPDEAERIAFKEDALSDEDARESIIDL